MENKTITFEPFDENREYFPPKRASTYSAGYDLCASEGFSITGGTQVLVRTNVKISMPHDMYGKIHPKSGLALRGYTVHQGVIDADYDKEVLVIMRSSGSSNHGYGFAAGEKIAQITFQKYETAGDEVVAERTGGFGSTGK